MDSSTELSRLERLGIRWLRHPVSAPHDGDDVLHTLDENEQRALAAVQRGAILRAALAGALSAGASVVGSYIGGDADIDPVRYWIWVGATTGVASVLELAYLYFDGVHSVARMARSAGLRLDDDEVDDAIRLGLARAALELPTPPFSQSGVHAHQESSKAVLLVMSLGYKLKVTVTNFLLKAVVRRALGRAAARLYLELVAIPVTALWNAVVAFRVLREARLRIVGCRAAPLLIEFIDVGPRQAELVVRTIACVIVRSARAHPNTEGLLGAVFALHPEVTRGPSLGNSRELLALVRDIPQKDVGVVLRAAISACIIDGALTFREKRFLEELFESADATLSLAKIKAACRHLTQGAGLEREVLWSLDPAKTEVAGGALSA